MPKPSLFGTTSLRLLTLFLAVGCSGNSGGSGTIGAGGQTVPGTGTGGQGIGVGGKASTGIGGAATTGGMPSTGGVPSSGDTTSKASASGAGGTVVNSTATSGGMPSTGGTTAKAGTTSAATGGAPSTGGTTAKGGSTATVTGGTSSTGGTTAKGGTSSTGGASSTGGTKATGGTTSVGGTTASGGATAQLGTPPGDIAQAAGTPLVAAHSMIRAMYAAYNGKLFQVRRASDSKTQEISVASAGGFVDLTALNTFCSATNCFVSRLYDQSGNVNDMWQATAANQPSVGFWTAGNGTKYPIAVSKGYQWLRNRTATKKIPTGSNPQTEYFVVHGDYAGRASGTNGCCYDYGNMETNIVDDGPGTMTALYFGDATDWTRGAGNGPWVMLDMENGVFAGGGAIAILNAGTASVNANDPSLKYPSPNIVTGLAKTNGTSTFALKYGNASTGTLSTAWSGSLPTNRNPTSYIPLQQQGGLSLGEGGDGSAMGTGAFSEGAIIAAQTSDATDNAIQANLTTVFK